MMTLQEAIAKVTKLLRLSESSNPHEAALAAQRAQEILTRYDIDRAALSLDGGSEPDEAIEDFSRRAPLDEGGKSLATWKLSLANTIAKANQSRIYRTGVAVGIVGRPSDVEKVRYLYDYLLREVDRLADRDGKGCGKTWRTQYRFGVVEAITVKLAETRAKVENEMRAEVQGTALVRVNEAIQNIERKDRALDAWVSANLKLRAGPRRPMRANHGAREAGREAGKSITISGARGSIASGNRRLS